MYTFSTTINTNNKHIKYFISDYLKTNLNGSNTKQKHYSRL
jgi:hypothetical protein